MASILIFGGTGRLGNAAATRLTAMGHHVAAFGRDGSEPIQGVNYAVFCQRYRGPDDACGEFKASILFTDEMVSRITFAEPSGIVLVSSVVGTRPDLVHSVSYQCAKAAVLHLRRYLELKYGVPITVLTPGAFTGKTIENSMESVVESIVSAIGV